MTDDTGEEVSACRRHTHTYVSVHHSLTSITGEEAADEDNRSVHAFMNSQVTARHGNPCMCLCSPYSPIHDQRMAREGNSSIQAHMMQFKFPPLG